MIDSIRIENLRSLKDTDFIKLKRLNILLGSNSSGKSTFLRSFPLFAQSVRKSLRGPISWFDDSMVDFGNYDTAMNFSVPKSEKISFPYLLKAPFNTSDFYGLRPSRFWLFDKVLSKSLGGVECKIVLSNDKNGTYVNSVILKIDSNVCNFFIEKREDYVQVIVNDNLYPIPKTKWLHNTDHFILPRFESVESNDSYALVTVRDALLQHIFNELKKYCRANFTKTERLVSIILAWSMNKNEFLNVLQQKSSLKSFHKHAKKWTIDSEEFLHIYDGILVYFFMNMFKILDKEMTCFYDNCEYVAPFRAEASRYYRSQGLQVDDIDSYGRNLQEFVSSLSKTQLEDYNSFLYNLLKIKISVKSSAGHYSIILNDHGKYVNMTDVGFGYSQILPILTKLWYAHSKKKLMRFRCFDQDFINNITLIEQPELHLHPAMQALVADALVDFLNFQKIKENQGLQEMVIVETHSQTIINRIGRRIREGKLSPNDVNVLLFQKNGLNTDTEIRVALFNENGQLKNWPFGFFDPDNL